MLLLLVSCFLCEDGLVVEKMVSCFVSADVDRLMDCLEETCPEHNFDIFPRRPCGVSLPLHRDIL